MNRLPLLIVLLMLAGWNSVGAQTDQDATYELSLSDCRPRFWLPDSDQYVLQFNQGDYQNEQVVDLCLSVRDQLGNIQTDPQISNVVISAADPNGTSVPVLNTYTPRLPGDDFIYEIILLLDASQSMTNSMTAMQSAARTAIRDSQLPNPFYAVYEFSNTAVSRQALTQDDQLIEAAVNAVQAQQGGSTCLYDAANTALQTPARNQWARRVILLFTDGRNDNNQGVCQMTTDEEVINMANARGVSIFAIGLTGNQGADQGQLEHLTSETNGAAVFGDRNALPGLFQAILTRLNSLRIIRTIVCGTGSVTLTLQANVSEKSARPDSAVVELGNTQCLAPTPVPEITPTPAPAFTELRVGFPSFEIAPNAEAEAVATFALTVTDRPDIARVQAQIIDSAKANAPEQPADCVKRDNVTWDCSIDVSDLAVGDVTLQVTVLDSSGNPLLDQPSTNARQNPNLEPALDITPLDGNLLVNITIPGIANLPVPDAVSFVTQDTTGVRSPLPSTGSGNGPYSLNLEQVNTDAVTIEARLTYGSSTKVVTAPNISLQRTLGQNLARFLRQNGLLVSAVILMAGAGVGWLVWRGRRVPQSRDDEWLRGSVPDATQVYVKPQSAAPKQVDDATRAFTPSKSIGDLEIVRLTADSSREGTRLPVTAPFTVGRGATCQLSVPDEFLSRVHLTLTQQDGMAFIEDMGSRNGSVVNGQALKPNEATALKNGAEITLGPNITLRFRHIIEQETRVVPPPAQK